MSNNNDGNIKESDTNLRIENTPHKDMSPSKDDVHVLFFIFNTYLHFKNTIVNRPDQPYDM